jgi:tetratricopeptide (TPR) repeat protein
MASQARLRPISTTPALLACLLGVGACAASSRGASQPAKVRSVELEPMRVEVARDGKGGTRVAVYDARELFDRAGAALDADRHDQALALYDRLVSSFPDSHLVAPALFNAGLALEGMGDLNAAVERYLEVARRARATRYGLDAHIRAGAVMAEQSRWSEALTVFDELAARSDLAAADRIEIRARRGYVMVESGRFDEAERALDAALELDQAGTRESMATRYFLAMAQYYLGEVARRKAEAVRLDLPEDQLQRDLEAKAKLVLVAQRRFEDAIRRADLYWATAAGYQLGSMQEDMWRALASAPVPDRLRAREAAIYTTEVRALARAHLDKARAAHAMNVRVADHHRTETPWSASSRRRIPEIDELLAREPGRADGARAAPARRDGKDPPPPAPARPRHRVPRRTDL